MSDSPPAITTLPPPSRPSATQRPVGLINEDEALARLAPIMRAAAGNFAPNRTKDTSASAGRWFGANTCGAIAVLLAVVALALAMPPKYRPQLAFNADDNTAEPSPLVGATNQHHKALVPHRSALVPRMSTEAKRQLSVYLNVVFPEGMCNTTVPATGSTGNGAWCLMQLPAQLVYRPLVAWNPHINVLVHSRFDIVATVILQPPACTESSTTTQSQVSGHIAVADIKALVDADLARVSPE